MKRIILSILIFLISVFNIKSQTISVNEPIIPILKNINNNILSEIVIDNNSDKIPNNSFNSNINNNPDSNINNNISDNNINNDSIYNLNSNSNSNNDSVYLNSIKITLKGDLLNNIENIKLYYSGNTSVIRSKTTSNTLLTDYNLYGSSTRIYADKDFSNLISSVDLKAMASLMAKMNSSANAKSGDITLNIKANKLLVQGENYFWIGVDINNNTNLLSTIEFEISDVTINGNVIDFNYNSGKRRVGYGLKNHNDDGVFAYRIPGLETTKSGRLVAIYDIRYDNAGDLQGNIDVGMSFSDDNGESWSKMKPILDFGEYGGLPNALNGVGDAAILYDSSQNRLWVAALWVHGLQGKGAWHNSKSGLDPKLTGQLVLTYSDDEGESWSKPINITKDVKDKSWRLFFNGPGKGIVMKNGTLVFACQHIDKDGIPYSGILFSEDKGQTWNVSHTNYSNTTEAQVVEIKTNVLMLNMRDNRGNSRAIYTTNDLGKSWAKHPSSNKLLDDPVCMASLIKIEANNNILGKDILLFSNPNSTKDRRNITIKISYDNGNSWSPKTILLDSEFGWGYSCLTQIDKSTIGILYEGSTSHLVFQKISLTDFQ